MLVATRRVAVALASLAAALALAGSIDAREWPSPPSWWLNSNEMTCVRIRESGNGRASSNLYGMMAGWSAAGGSGSAWRATRAEQHWRAWLLWRRYGCHQPWGRYDHCC